MKTSQNNKWFQWICAVGACAAAAPAQAQLPSAPAVEGQHGFAAQVVVSQAAPDTQPAGMAGASSLTRQQVEALALRNNPRITVRHLLSLAQEQGVRVARSPELPQLIGSITGEEADDGGRLSSGGLNSSRLLRHVGGGVMLDQLITDFGQTRNQVASSRLQQQAQQSREQATREDVVLVADQLFYKALQAQAVLQVADQTVKARQATQSQIGELTKNNLRSTLDASFADVNVSQAQLLKLDAQNNADAAMAQLDEVLGLDHEQNYTLVSDPQAAPPPPPDVDMLVKTAIAQRPDLRALQQQSASQQKLSRAQEDQNLPTLSALGTVGGTPVRSGEYYKSSWDGAVAANLEVPLFNGFRYSAEARQTHLQAQASDAQALALRNSIVRDVHIAWLAANNAFRRIAVTALLVRQAELSLNLAQTRYNLGLSSIVELTDAQLAQTQAQIAYSDARYRYRSALASLRFTSGQQE
jgi:outer membrane protein